MFKEISETKKLSFFVTFVFIVLAAYFAWFYVSANNTFVPADFLEANNQGALVAFQIVDISHQSYQNLSQINDLDKQYRYSEAIDLVLEEMERNSELKQKAYELSLSLGKMTEELSGINPPQATEAALRAINYETTLIIRLLNYSEFLNDLLQALQGKFSGQTTGEEIGGILKKINNEVVAINDLNLQYQEAINRFEELTK